MKIAVNAQESKKPTAERMRVRRRLPPSEPVNRRSFERRTNERTNADQWSDTRRRHRKLNGRTAGDIYSGPQIAAATVSRAPKKKTANKYGAAMVVQMHGRQRPRVSVVYNFDIPRSFQTAAVTIIHLPPYTESGTRQSNK